MVNEAGDLYTPYGSEKGSCAQYWRLAFVFSARGFHALLLRVWSINPRLDALSFVRLYVCFAKENPTGWTDRKSFS